MPAKAGIQYVNGIARFARDLKSVIAGGSAPAPWVTWTRTIPGPRPAGRLHLSKFDPIEFVFARAKTILPEAKLGAHSAPAGPAPGTARAKVTKESTPPDGATPSLRFSPESALASTRRALRCAPRAQTRDSLLPIPAAMLGRDIRGLKKHARIPRALLAQKRIF
jgi:hypothetical protein